MTAKKKLHDCAAFTLAETLVALLILMMVSSIVAAGIPVAARAYEKVTRAANAEVLLSTSVSALRDELATARKISVGSDGKTLTYYSADTGSFARIYPYSDDAAGKNGVLMLREYIGFDEGSVSGSASGGGAAEGVSSGESAGIAHQLVTDAAATKDLFITYGSVSLEDGIVTVRDLQVRRESSEETVTSIETLYIRTLNDPE